MAPSTALQLFYRYKESGDHNLRNEIIAGYMHLIKNLVGKYADGCAIPAGDLMHEAWFGFAEALETYDPLKGGVISTYCYHRANLRLQDAVQVQSHIVRVPTRGHRALVKYNRKVEAVVNEYENPYLPVDVVLGGLQPNEIDGVHALLGLLTSSRSEPGENDASDELNEFSRDREIARRTLQQLPEPQKTITLGYYELTPKNFAKLCKKHGRTAEEGERIMQGSLRKIQRAISLQTTAAPVPVTRKTRIFEKAEQLVLIKKVPKGGRVAAPLTIRKVRPAADATQLVLQIG